MAIPAEVYEELNLHVSADRIFIEPLDQGELLVIDRVTDEISLHDNSGQIPATSTTKRIYGIVGIIRLIAGPYLIVITGRKNIGQINGQNIWQITNTEVISCTRTLFHLTEKQSALNSNLLTMLEFMLKVPNYYYSYSYDITHTLQRLHNTPPDFLQLSLLRRSDLRFVWNGYLLKPFSEQGDEYNKYCLPIMQGFISINTCSLNGNPFIWTLLSRRCCYRAGTRFFMRGIDQDGNVANFVETEQILEFQGDRSSFVQTRGSMPFFWNQLPNLKYKPKPVISEVDNHVEAFVKHFQEQILQYGRQILVNLVDQRGAEGNLERQYKDLVNLVANPNIRYEFFDFHHECRNMKWHRLNILIDRVAHEQDEFGYFVLARDGAIISQQEGVFRTNCIDCLDRTNVVQSMLARRSLQSIMERLGILTVGQRIENQPAFETLFKNIWADNADLISEQYSGTKALKTDFTRTGKRSVKGALNDGMNSLTRYYKNNFTDGFRQDAIDLFLGNFCTENNANNRTIPAPLDVERGWKYFTFPFVLMAAIMMFLLCLVSIEYSTMTLVYLLFWGLMSAYVANSILRQGPEYVDLPKVSKHRNKMIPALIH